MLAIFDHYIISVLLFSYFFVVDVFEIWTIFEQVFHDFDVLFVCFVSLRPCGVSCLKAATH